MVWSRKTGEWLDRRDKSRKPNPEMRWSAKYKLWMDKDTRTPAQRKQDEAIAKDFERRAKSGELDRLIEKKLKGK
jgi:hypothetical protein